MWSAPIRNRRVVVGTVIAALFVALALAGNAPEARAAARKADVSINGVKAAPDELLVKFVDGRAGQALASVQAETGIKVVSSRRFRLIDWYYVKVKTPLALPDTLRAFARNADVLDVEPNYVVRAAVVPNDPMYGALWGMDRIGAPGAWDRRTESGVLVAVIDTGVDYTHPDLAANMWVNPGEIPGDGLDNDLNGFVDDVHGWDFYDNDCDPMDYGGHGTHVAGTIGAVGNNATGVVGVCWNVRIMALQFLSPGGTGHVLDAIDAIEYATLNGAEVMNNSWGGGGYSRAMEEAIWMTDGFGALFVAAAGNSGNDNDENPFYPATYEIPNVISVAATNPADYLWGQEEPGQPPPPPPPDSNYGDETVHLAAPGTSILSTTPYSSYSTYTGTSMAAPHVSGACALVWAEHPGLSHREVKSLILRSVDLPYVEEPEDDPETENPLIGLIVTEGRLSVGSGIGELHIVTPDVPPYPVGDYYSVTIKATGGVPPYTWDFPEGGLPAALEWLSINPDTGVISGSDEDAASGEHEFTVRVTDSATPEAAEDTKQFKLLVDGGYILWVRSEPFTGVLVRWWHRGRTDYWMSFPRPAPGQPCEVARMKAPLQWADQHFYRWEDEHGWVLGYEREISLSICSSREAVAVYDTRQNLYVNDETAENGIAPGDDANDGLSPATPKRHIQAMLDQFAAAGYVGAEWRLIVAAGTYYENVVLGEAHSGLAFQGHGWGAAIIDAGQNGPCIYADGWASGEIIGFSLTNGLGVGGGGGIQLVNGCSVKIARNWIYGNSAPEGGAIAGYSSTAAVKDNYIWDNAAEDKGGEGGAILFVQSDYVLIEGNYIAENSAFHGAGIRCWFSVGWITNNIIEHNVAGGWGGGIYASGGWIPIDQNRMIGWNTAARGGGIFSYASTAPLADNTIVGNEADVAGGGICSDYFSDQPILSSTIAENSAAYGGGIFCSQSTPPISGNGIWANTAEESGGGIFLSERLSPQICGNDISFNSAGVSGGAIYLSRGCSPTIGTPSMLFWSNYMERNSAGDYGGHLYCGPESSPTVLNNYLGDGTAELGGGIYCVDSSGRFGSGCHAGSNSIYHNTAYLHGGGVYITGVPSPDFSTNSIYYNVAEEGGGIYCDAGTTPEIGGGWIGYNEAYYGAGMRIVSASPVFWNNLPVAYNEAFPFNEGASVTNAGGGCGGGIYMTDSTVVMEVVHLYGNVAPEGPGLYCIDSTVEMNACTVERHECEEAPGAGILALGSELRITDSVIMKNSAPMGGGIYVGGIYLGDDLVERSSLLVAGTTFQSNEAGYGAALYVAEADVVLSAEATATLSPDEGGFNNMVQNAAWQGSGVYWSEDASGAVTTSRFGESNAGQGAGIFCADGSAPLISNALFIGNSATRGSGIYCSEEAWPQILNIGAIGNSALDGGAGIHSANPKLRLRNSIFWLNNVDIVGVAASYSCIEDPQGGVGNFSGDPLLVGPAFEGRWDDPDPEDDDPEVVFWSPYDPPNVDNFGDDLTVAGTTRFTTVLAGVAEDQFVGMWLNPNIRQNVQFLIVGNTDSKDGHNGGTDIYVRGNASDHGEVWDQFHIWDYHPTSTEGHWTYGGWVQDPVTSLCVDAGNPADPYGGEAQPNGWRINVGPYGNTEQASLSTERVPYLMAEAGVVWVDQDWTRVELSTEFNDPVVVAGPATSFGVEPGVVRLRNITNASFEIRFQEWDYLDGWHPLEQVHWIAVEKGVYDLPGDNKLIAGTFSTFQTNVYTPVLVEFPEPFDGVPILVAQVQTYTGSDAVTDRICAVRAGGFDFAMQEQEASGPHGWETVGYIAVTEDAGAIGSVSCRVRGTAAVVTDEPVMVGSECGSALVRVEEEQSLDLETSHGVGERVGFIGIAGQPPLVADMQTCNGTDTSNLRCTLLAQAFQGEEGVVSAGSAWQTVELDYTYQAPVVVAGPATYDGSEPGVVRVRNVTPDSFDIRFQEWNYLDGWHPAEDIHYAVVERGLWQVDEEALLTVDKLDVDNWNVYVPGRVHFPLPYEETPDEETLVVVATQQTANGNDAVTERLSAVDTEGFSVAVQEEQAGGWHPTETLGYFAPGEGRGGVEVFFFGMPDVEIGSDETTDGSLFLLGWEILIVEEQSLDPETFHCEEVIGWMAFDFSAATPYFLADMQTCDGFDTASLRCRSTSPGGFMLEVSAQDGSGRELDDVDLTVEFSGQGGDGQITVLQGSSVQQSCEASDTVTLNAPESILDGESFLSFDHWEVNGEAMAAGVTVIEVEIDGDVQAVAIYQGTAPALP